MGYETVFIIEAVTLNPTTFIVPPEEYPLLEAKLPILESYLTITWTATHAVKASFLALFRQLITRTGKGMRVWWWCAAGTTAVSWIFFACEPFMLCPYSTAEISKCLPGPPYDTAVGLTAVGTILDIISDSMSKVCLCPLIMISFAYKIPSCLNPHPSLAENANEHEPEIWACDVHVPVIIYDLRCVCPCRRLRHPSLQPFDKNILLS